MLTDFLNSFTDTLSDNTHTHTRMMALCLGLPGSASTRKVKPNWILLKQETVSGSGISWATYKSAPCSRQITTPAPHHSVFLQAGCPSCRPTHSIKALKALDSVINLQQTLNISQQYVATLPCEIRMPVNWQQSEICIVSNYYYAAFNAPYVGHKDDESHV